MKVDIDDFASQMHRFSEELRAEIRSRDLRIENLQREFATQTARAVAAEKALADSEAWLTKIRRALNDAGLVRGDYEASVKALIDDSKRLEKLSLTPAREPVEKTLLDVARTNLELMKQERDGAVGLLRAMARVEAEARAFLYELPDDEED